MYVTDLFYEYRKRGVLFTINQAGKILNITLNISGNGDSIYQTLRGRTSRGLEFKEKMILEDVYGIYGRPEETLLFGVNVHTKLQEGKSLRVDMGKAGLTLYYLQHGLSFDVSKEIVGRCTISRIGSKS